MVSCLLAMKLEGLAILMVNYGMLTTRFKFFAIFVKDFLSDLNKVLGTTKFFDPSAIPVQDEGSLLDSKQ